MTVEEILDGVQSYLHDSGDIWPRAELLRILNDGYRQFITTALSVVRVFQLDVPPRDTGAGTFEWEDTYVNGQFRHFGTHLQDRGAVGTYRWESEFVAGTITPTDSYDGITHLWEQAYNSADVDDHFRFVLARTHTQPRYAFWGNKRLYPRAVSELDLRDQRWWVESGEPIFFLTGKGRELSFEIFEVETAYTQTHFLQDSGSGIPRLFSSDASRSYAVASQTTYWDYAYTSGEDNLSVPGLGYKITTLDATNNRLYMFDWEADITTTSDGDSAYVATYPWEFDADILALTDTALDVPQLGVGLLRGVESTDRAYLPMDYDTGQRSLGIARDWHSADNSISVFEHITTGRPLTEDDTPDLIPTQLHKFLKYYTLSKAFLRPGEGFRPDLSDLWGSLYSLGVETLAVLATPSSIDSALARGQNSAMRTSTPPKVRLPSTYPRVHRNG